MGVIDSRVDRTVVVLAAVQVRLSAEAASSSSLSHTAGAATSITAAENLRETGVKVAFPQPLRNMYADRGTPLNGWCRQAAAD